VRDGLVVPGREDEGKETRGSAADLRALARGKRRTRIELASLPWKGKALPLSYRRTYESAPTGGSSTMTVCTNDLALVDLA
jgi:hypothetical protein